MVREKVQKTNKKRRDHSPLLVLHQCLEKNSFVYGSTHLQNLTIENWRMTASAQQHFVAFSVAFYHIKLLGPSLSDVLKIAIHSVSGSRSGPGSL